MWSSTAEAPVLLVGSAHVLDLEAALRRVLADRPLDAIALELDAERAAALLSSAAPTGGGRSGAPIVLRLWAGLQRRLGEQMGGGVAGAEMRTAAAIANERGLRVLLIDDPIRETLGRLMRSMSFRERLTLAFGAILGLVIPTRVVKDQLERYQEAPAPFLEEVRRSYPGIAKVLLDDRNEHMADRLVEARRSGLGRIAAVVGDAHLAGLAMALGRRGVLVETIPLSELSRVTGPSTGPSPPR